MPTALLPAFAAPGHFHLPENSTLHKKSFSQQAATFQTFPLDLISQLNESTNTSSTAQGSGEEHLSNWCQLQLVNCNIIKSPHVEGDIIQHSFQRDHRGYVCSVTGFLEHLSQLLVHLCHLPNVQKVNFFKMQLRSLLLIRTVETPAFRCACLPLCSLRPATRAASFRP